MEFKLKTSTGERVSVWGEPSDTVADLKRKISMVLGPGPPINMCLGGEPIPDNATVPELSLLIAFKKAVDRQNAPHRRPRGARARRARSAERRDQPSAERRSAERARSAERDQPDSPAASAISERDHDQPSNQERSRSPILRERSRRPIQRQARSRSPIQRQARSRSPIRRQARSRSPIRRQARSRSPIRRGAQARSRSRWQS